MTKILFCDIDGTLTETISGAKFKQHPRDVKIIPGADNAIADFVSRGYKCVGISNQGGVGAGHKLLEDAIAEMRYTLDLFPGIIGIYFCPDFDGQHCWLVARNGESPIHTAWAATWSGTFRKPNAGMIWAAILNHCGSQKPEDSLMVGDRPEDQECVENAGINFIAADVWRNQFKLQ